ncbi:MAG: hypothetical protein AAGF83_25635 [Cyanobacteria bacterium P01_G01_bin.67]
MISNLSENLITKATDLEHIQTVIAQKKQELKNLYEFTDIE